MSVAPLSTTAPVPRAGETLPQVARTVDQATIDAYARASGDFNPIHVDPAFAATGPFGRTIAHGLMTLAYVAEMLNGWSRGAFDAAGTLDIAFVGPVFAGDRVEVNGTVDDVGEQDGRAVASITLEAKAGERTILAGRARIPLATQSGTMA
ncbi:MaoC family dehydratase [uncultured Alsobacter sp.]|uniref:MaoC family dehydratase n=1 Tax=uncultured Alsobacter sp. TaxID=1748258 RepID=UPI0025F0B336|nr:MaoC family dehydratase [uncultured Alsobacter sp.]